MAKLYDTDLSGAAWALVEPLLPPARPGGRPRSPCLRAVLNAIFYLLRSGCQWRLLPREYPPWSTVHHYFRTWRRTGVGVLLHRAIYKATRAAVGRDPCPSVVIMDGQSVKTTERGGARGFDAHKKVKGRKRHILVDMPGLMVSNRVEPAGAYADHLVVEPDDPRAAIEKRPLHVPAERAALVPFAGLVAYAGLVTYGKLPRHAADARVLIVGASGGVGHLAVQMAKHGLGVGHVVGVTSSRNAEFVRNLGADDVIPHDHVPVETIPERHPEWSRSFDLILDGVGLDAYFKIVAPRLLKPTGRFVSAALPQVAPGRAGEDVGLWGALRLLGVLGTRILRGRYALITGLIGGLPTKDGFPEIVRWLAEGKLTPHLSAAYDLDRIGDAHRASETGRTVGKIGIRISAQAVVPVADASTASGDPDAERLERPLASAS